jgi:hypothetical protein
LETAHIPIDSWNCLPKLLLGFLKLKAIDMAVDTPDLFSIGNTPTHPLGTRSQLVVGCENRPVQCEIEWDKSVDRPYCFAI